MVSFQSPFIQLNQRKTILDSDTDTKKRKWDNDLETEELLPKYKKWMNYKADDVATTKSSFDIELHLETPLPSEWQRCLDIQSGEIYFYNTRTQKTTVRDPRDGPGPDPNPTSPRDCHMSLDLELNLPCGSLNNNSSSKCSQETKPIMTKKSSTSPPRAAPSDLFKILSNNIEKTSLYGSTKDEETVEMVAAACMRCHMLVVLQKSSPTCPNCKFVHPPYQTTPEMFKPKLSLSS